MKTTLFRRAVFQGSFLILFAFLFIPFETEGGLRKILRSVGICVRSLEGAADSTEAPLPSFVDVAQELWGRKALKRHAGAERIEFLLKNLRASQILPLLPELRSQFDDIWWLHSNFLPPFSSTTAVRSYLAGNLRIDLDHLSRIDWDPLKTTLKITTTYDYEAAQEISMHLSAGGVTDSMGSLIDEPLTPETFELAAYPPGLKLLAGASRFEAREQFMIIETREDLSGFPPTSFSDQVEIAIFQTPTDAQKAQSAFEELAQTALLEKLAVGDAVVIDRVMNNFSHLFFGAGVTPADLVQYLIQKSRSLPIDLIFSVAKLKDIYFTGSKTGNPKSIRAYRIFENPIPLGPEKRFTAEETLRLFNVTSPDEVHVVTPATVLSSFEKSPWIPIFRRESYYILVEAELEPDAPY